MIYFQCSDKQLQRNHSTYFEQLDREAKTHKDVGRKCKYRNGIYIVDKVRESRNGDVYHLKSIETDSTSEIMIHREELTFIKGV